MKLSISTAILTSTSILLASFFLGSIVVAAENHQPNKTIITKKRSLKTPKAPSTSSNFEEQVFYSNEATELHLDVGAADDDDDSATLNYAIELGVLRGSSKKSAKDTTALIQASFTTSIEFDFDNYDDDAAADFDATVYLSMFAYSGCDSAASCDAAGITPTPLLPERIVMVGWYRNWEFDFDDALDDMDFDDIFTSTNQGNFILSGKGSGDIYLKAVISISEYVSADSDEDVDIRLTLKNWVMVINDGQDFFIQESNGAVTDDLTALPPP